MPVHQLRQLFPDQAVGVRRLIQLPGGDGQAVDPRQPLSMDTRMLPPPRRAVRSLSLMVGSSFALMR